MEFKKVHSGEKKAWSSKVHYGEKKAWSSKVHSGEKRHEGQKCIVVKKGMRVKSA